MAAPDIQTALQTALAAQAQDDRAHQHSLRINAELTAERKQIQADFEKGKSGMTKGLMDFAMAWNNPKAAVQHLLGFVGASFAAASAKAKLWEIPETPGFTVGGSTANAGSSGNNKTGIKLAR